MKIKLPITKKEIEIKDFISRKIDREYLIILAGKWETTRDEKWIPNMKMNAEAIQKAFDYLVIAMTGLSQSEIDDLPKKDFEFLQAEIDKINSPS